MSESKIFIIWNISLAEFVLKVFPQERPVNHENASELK